MGWLCVLATLSLVGAVAACTTQDCGAGKWCGGVNGQGPDACVTVDAADAATYCTCTYSKTWSCPSGTENPSRTTTCCRPAPPAWGSQTYPTGCPSANQWCGSDPANAGAGNHCQVITDDKPCVLSRLAEDPPGCTVQAPGCSVLYCPTDGENFLRNDGGDVGDDEKAKTQSGAR